MQNNTTEHYFTPQIKTNNFHHYVLSVLGALVPNTPLTNTLCWAL